ncbi:MAG TPA: imidazolonepropionase [Vicinamibacteria bacterium]|nr:imidazolonepropionase [Vicinamibacteria bacterium]
MTSADFAVRRIGILATLAGPAPRTGTAMRELSLVRDAALAADSGRIAWIGPDAALESAVALRPGAETLDAAEAAVVPGFVDPHTHLAFAGDRDDEIRRRLAGASYQEIAAAGGGIVRSVEATRAASVEDLAALVAARLDEMLLCGTTTAEVKSGYGLETAAEIRSLEAIRLAASRHPITVVPTFLGAHEVPREHRGDRSRYVDLLVDEMIPAVAGRGLAAFADVFCEEGVFSVEDSRRILLAARERGMKLRIHADELATTGGAELAGELGARSADHLVFVSRAGMKALADASCVATLLPAAAFYLRLGRFAPARALVEAGAPLALASDVNPGGGLSPSLPFAMAVGCFSMGLALEEALAAVTVNAAFSLDLQAEAGSIEVGKRADLVLLRSPRLLDLVRVGVPAIRAVVKDGRVVVRDGRLVEPGPLRRS